MYDKLWILKDSHFGKRLLMFAYVFSELYNYFCLFLLNKDTRSTMIMERVDTDNVNDNE